MRRVLLALFLALPLRAAQPVAGSPSDPSHRTGDEILICGQLFHTGTKVVLFSDPSGYDGSKYTGGPVTRPATQPTTQLAATQPYETLRGPDLTFPELRKHVDQFVLHFDACGTSRECFNVLQRRRLSVHFMCDLDGTIYQTLDLKEEAYHATIANARSVGVEIANLGGWEGPEPARFKEWYQRQGTATRINVPAKQGPQLTPNFVGHPARPLPVPGTVQGKFQLQYDYTPEQYAALEHLAATLCTVFPKIQPDYPRQLTTAPTHTTHPATTRAAAITIAAPDQPGHLINHVLSPDLYETYQGLLGHYHVQLNKDDPGPAFQWDKLITATRALMTPEARAENLKWRNQPVGVGPTRPTTGPNAATRATTKP